jgi:LysM repeat protein
VSTQTPRASGRRSSRQPESEDSFPPIAEPRQGHTGHLLAFVSVLAVLGFGVWSAIGTLATSAERPGDKVIPTALPTQMPAAAPTQAATPPSAAAVGSPTASTTATPGGTRVHVVGQGDNLYRIAQRYNTTIEAIMAANGITDRSKILHIGDRLIIP